MDTPETLIARVDALAGVISRKLERRLLLNTEEERRRRVSLSPAPKMVALTFTEAEDAIQVLRDAAHALSGATPTGKEMVQLIADHSVAGGRNHE